MYARAPCAPMVAVAMEPNVVLLEIVSGMRVSAKDHVAKSSIEVSFAEKVMHRSWTIVMKVDRGYYISQYDTRILS